MNLQYCFHSVLTDTHTLHLHIYPHALLIYEYLDVPPVLSDTHTFYMNMFVNLYVLILCDSSKLLDV